MWGKNVSHRHWRKTIMSHWARPSKVDASLLWIHKRAIANSTVTCQEWESQGLFIATLRCLPRCLVEAEVFLSPSQAVWTTEAEFKRGLGVGVLHVPHVYSMLILYKKPQLCCLVRVLEREQGLSTWKEDSTKWWVIVGESSCSGGFGEEWHERMQNYCHEDNSQWKHLQGNIAAVL